MTGLGGLGRIARSAVVAALSLVASLSPGAAPVLAAGSTSAAAACVDSWLPVALPAGLSAMEPMGGTALSGEPAWIVGLASATAEGKRVPLIGHWVNGAWAKTAAPWGTYGVLNAVVATSPTNAWTVGDIGTYTRWPILARWDGTSWKSASVPGPPGHLGALPEMPTRN